MVPIRYTTLPVFGENPDNNLEDEETIMVEILSQRNFDLELSSVSLIGKNYTVLPPSIGKIPGLRRLNLKHGKIERCEIQQGDFPKLRELKLNFNPLVGFPLSLCSLIQLEKLALSGTGLREIPKEIQLLTRLHSLDLSNNYLTTVPSEIGALLQLHTLRLHNNRLETFPPEMSSLTKLTVFTFFQNPLCYMPPMNTLCPPVYLMYSDLLSLFGQNEEGLKEEFRANTLKKKGFIDYEGPQFYELLNITHFCIVARGFQDMSTIKRGGE